MREDTIFALLTATAVGIVGLAWFLWMDAQEQKKSQHVDLTNLRDRIYRTERSSRWDWV
jgi:hypothetical protein